MLGQKHYKRVAKMKTRKPTIPTLVKIYPDVRVDLFLVLENFKRNIPVLIITNVITVININISIFILSSP